MEKVRALERTAADEAGRRMGMSWGMCICSECKREVHQGRRKDQSLYWFHCEDKTDACLGSRADYAQTTAEVKGRWCGMDGRPE